ncbi:MAG: aminoglycoside phosphotransferase family protein [Rhodanobacteraceae bacterium]|nr:MAG: aminoglycoside phosphotransferase family protein [Rhodanobacteraceae bacterium]
MSATVELEPGIADGLRHAWGIGIHANCTSLGHGLINRTLLVADGDRRCVLQRINTNVFPDPALLMRNYRAVTAHLARQHAGGRYAYSTLELVPTSNGDAAAVLPDGSWWRLYNYVADTCTFNTADHPATALEAGRGFGAFAAALSGLDASGIGEVIPHFHDPERRFAAFRKALADDRMGRAADAAQTCAAALAYADVLPHWRSLLARGLPRRITHNDCKLNNLLFDAVGRAICVIDLDTVMPGSVLFDFGDMCRTMLSPVPEDSTDLARVGVRHDYFAALARGYVEGSGDMLTPLERDNLVFGARLIVGVIGLRFLTDYLDGDRYFRTTHPGHNLERARNQLALYAALTAQQDALQALVPASPCADERA